MVPTTFLLAASLLASPTLSAAYGIGAGVRRAAAVPTLAPLRSAALFMQEAEPEAAEPPAKVELGTDSPLTSFAKKDAEMTLEEFNRKKAADNKARNEIRARNNVLIPAVCAIAYAVALFIGEDNVKANLKEMGSGGDPFANTPGMAETRERKAKGLAIAAEKQDKAATAVRTAIRGEEAVREAEMLQAQQQ